MRPGIGAETHRNHPKAAPAADLPLPRKESPPFHRGGILCGGRPLQQTQRGLGFGFHFFLATWRLRTGTVS
ncbi:hypothetical protein LH20_15325 [Sphingopyxis sp. 113P3]|nr:hypothetical protein LH20_15325 [Sphingopyxis sp. 113P3]